MRYKRCRNCGVYVNPGKLCCVACAAKAGNYRQLAAGRQWQAGRQGQRQGPLEGGGNLRGPRDRAV
jgi:hypothetical protein